MTRLPWTRGTGNFSDYRAPPGGKQAKTSGYCCLGRVYDAQHNALGSGFQINQPAVSSDDVVNGETVTAAPAKDFDVAWLQNLTPATSADAI